MEKVDSLALTILLSHGDEDVLFNAIGILLNMSSDLVYSKEIFKISVQRETHFAVGKGSLQFGFNGFDALSAAFVQQFTIGP